MGTEVVPATADEQPEHQSHLADEGELPDADGVVLHQHGSEAVDEIAESGDHQQDAKIFNMNPDRRARCPIISRWTPKRISPTSQMVV